MVAILPPTLVSGISRPLQLDVIPTSVEVHHVERVKVDAVPHKVERCRHQVSKSESF